MSIDIPSGKENVPRNIERAEQPKILTDICFEMQVAGSKIFYRNSAPGRKIIFLEDSSPVMPEPDKPYDVAIISDTNPSEPAKGKYIVKIISESVDADEGAGIRREASEKKRGEEGARESPIWIDREKRLVYILDIALPWVGKETSSVPKAEEFPGFTMDMKTLKLLRKVAMAVRDSHSCLLEGETATAKTSCILYLAMLTGNEVERLNLDGQTDTSELIGKFIPNEGQLQITFEQLLKAGESLKSESRDILARAKTENRPLTLVESQKIAIFEGLPIAEWRWQDGYVPRAMKHGRWLVLDEINLCEQQILKRLHPALENNPTLALTEYDGRKIAKHGDEELSPLFRVFGTMNPPETHPDCKPLTPAFRGRWLRQIFAEVPTCSEYESMLRFLISGKQPVVEHDGIKFQQEQEEPRFPLLGKIAMMREMPINIASFHEDMEQMARTRGIGKNRQETYVFTRRNLLAFMDFLQNHQLMDRRTGKVVTIREDPQRIIIEGLELFYLDAIAEEGDKQIVKNALKTNGLTRKNWLLKPSDKKLPNASMIDDEG